MIDPLPVKLTSDRSQLLPLPSSWAPFWCGPLIMPTKKMLVGREDQKGNWKLF